MIFKYLGMIVLSFGFVTCEAPLDSSHASTKLFRSISALESGIDFANRIRENDQRNFLTYPYIYNGGGVAIGDLNNDGLADIYFTGNMVGDHLYLNKGKLHFEEVTVKSGILQTNMWTTGVTMADVNNDGWLDIYVCRSGTGSFRHNLLYINKGEGKFSEQAKSYGLNDSGYSVQASFFDYDLDGDLDMYLVNHSVQFFSGQEQLFAKRNNPHPSEADRLYENKGNKEGQDHPYFEDVSINAGINHFAFGLSATIADFNNDHYPDIYVASDFFEPDFLYINQRNGQFINQLDVYVGHTSFSSMGSDAADFNNDGFTDLFVCDMQAADNFRKKANMASMDTDRFQRMVEEGYHYQYMQNTLQLNSGMGRFSEIAELAGVSETDWSWGPLFCDLDNDGWKDLFISNGVRRDIQYKDILTDIGQKVYDPRKINTMELIEKFPVERLKNYSYKNSGGLLFTDMSDQWGIDFEGFSTGAAYADLDNDGDLDLVMNNLDDLASLYENKGEDQTENNYLKISLRGEKDNYFGVGSKITLHSNDQTQYQYVQSTHGFQSAVSPEAHFGLGVGNQVDKIEVTWPNATVTIVEDVTANQHITIKQENFVGVKDLMPGPKLFSDVTKNIGVEFTHQEIPYDDFVKEILLPHKYSQLGPFIAVGDVNQDLRDDFYVGGAHEQSGQLFIQNEAGLFKLHSSSTWDEDKTFEDVAGAFFDSDGDGDLDLYIVSGSNEWDRDSDRYLDRLYVNDGHGQFTKNAEALPPLRISGSCVKPADFDGDGDLDLFIGGRIISGQYPLSGRSYFLENRNGIFTDATAKVVGSSFKPGMVSDAEWLDYDADQDLDLVVVGEWMPITVFQNTSGKLKRIEVPGLEKSSGWWYSLALGDMDQDGDADLIAGNLGLNYKYSASTDEPFQAYAYDFDENNSLDIVLGYFDKGELFPLRGRQCSAEQMPSLANKFKNYSEFASATLVDVYGKRALDQAIHLEAYTFASTYIENLGQGQFTMHLLPIEAQISSVNGIIIEDLNNDRHLDIILAGNMFGSEVETARNDAGLGLVLLGKGNHSFTPLPSSQSGLVAAGDVKSLSQFSSSDGNRCLLIGNNDGQLQVLKKNDSWPK